MASIERNSGKRISFVLATAAIPLFCYFVAALVVLHVLKPDYTVVDHMVSDYAVGRYGWIMTTAFASAALGCLMLGAGLLGGGPVTWTGRLGAILLLITSAGLTVTAIFPTDLETAPSTRTGDIHAMSFFVNIVAILLSALLLGFSYRGAVAWQRYKAAGLGFAALLVVAFVAQFQTLHKGAPYGITNRVFVAILMAWLVSTSLWLREVVSR